MNTHTPGRFYKIAADSVGIDLVGDVDFDTTAMSAKAIISTPAPDRVRDVLRPEGCQLDNYQRNPVVLWEHGSELSLPIGISEDPAGKLTVKIDQGGVRAECFFTNKLRESEQIFALVAEKFIRATSVRAMPLKSSLVNDGDGELYVFEEWDLEEWSWCSVGMNPEAVAGVVSKNRLAGSQICEPILKSLKAIAPPRRAVGRGWKASPPLASVPDPMIDNEGPASVAEDAPVMEQIKVMEQPYGELMLRATHRRLTDLVDRIAAAVVMVENPQVKRKLEDFIANQTEVITLLESTFASVYPGSEKLSRDVAGCEVVHLSRRDRMEMIQAGTRLEIIAKTKGLDRRARYELMIYATRLKTCQTMSVPAPDPALQALRDERERREGISTLKSVVHESVVRIGQQLNQINESITKAERSRRC